MAPGDRVAALTVLGGWAELAVAPAMFCIALPEALSFEQGAGLILNYHTAYFALALRARLAAGETVLVHGAAGGVGTATLQVAKGLKAQTIAVVSSDAKEEIARRAGADHVLRSDARWREQALEITDGGVDVVVDPVGGDRFLDSLRSLREGGRLVVIGFTAGAIPELRVNRLLLKNVEVVGAGWGEYIRDRSGSGGDGRRCPRAPDRGRARVADRRREPPAAGCRGGSGRARGPRGARQGRADGRAERAAIRPHPHALDILSAGNTAD